MKLSTVLTITTVISSVATAGVCLYLDNKRNKKVQEKTVEKVTVSDNEENDEEESVETKSNVNCAVTMVIAAVGGVVLGQVYSKVAVPKILRHLERDIVYETFQRAEANGNLSFDKLIELAYKVKQEVA